MAVVYQVSTDQEAISTQTTTTSAVTFAGTNRSAIVTLTVLGPVTGITVTCGGINCSPVAGATQTGSTFTTTQYCTDTEPPSGSQTATASWTNAVSSILGLMQASNVDQATPVINGTASTYAFGSSSSATITSTSGDLTTSTNFCSATDRAQTTNQTPEPVANNAWSCQDIGPGTGTTTHTWSHGNTNMMTVGSNFKAAGGGGGGTTIAGLGRRMQSVIYTQG